MSSKVRAETKEFAVCDQLTRSGTAPGALIREATEAESPKDMHHKFGIALKEARETEYWLQILIHGIGICEEDLTDTLEKLDSVTAMLVASRKTLKKRINST